MSDYVIDFIVVFIVPLIAGFCGAALAVLMFS